MQIKNFHLIRSLERNTLSELFLARHVHEDYYVKIRLYDQLSITNEEVREAILQRLRNSYQMRHRNIIATLDYGVEGRYMYQVHEHMDFGTLEDLLQKTSHIPPEISAYILQEILRGLQYAHSIGIFHGMLNPAKVLLSQNGIVKVDDFQFLDLKNTFLKQVQTRIKRKQQMYLAPEHLLGKEADHRCDFFSAGVVAFRMLTGKHPFLEEQSEWTTMQITACSAKLLFELDPTLPPSIEELVEKMIEKEACDRIQNAEDALRPLEDYIDGFGEVRSYEVLANYLKKPQQSADQLNQLRCEEYLQQASHYQMQEQWDRSLVAYQRSRFLRPKDKTIENEIRAICKRLAYVAADSKDPKLLQLEQSLRANPDNIQILQRLATLAKSRGDLIDCIVYYKRILKLSPEDSYAAVQLRQFLHGEDKESAVAANDAKWVRWQEFYRRRKRPIWQKWTLLQGNLSLLVAVAAFAVLIGAAHALNWIPRQMAQASAITTPVRSPMLITNQKINRVCDQAALAYKEGEIKRAIELLAKTPLPEKGPATARARLQLAGYWLQLDSPERALQVLEQIDLSTAELHQKILAYKLKGESFRIQKRYGHAIDQYINIKALPGIASIQQQEADEKIQAIQNEAHESIVD